MLYVLVCKKLYSLMYILGCVGSPVLCVIVVSESHSLVGTCGFLIAVASLVAEHKL